MTVPVAPHPHQHMIVVMVSQVNIYVENYQIIHFNYVQFIVYKLNHNKAVKIFSKNYIMQ